MLVDGVLCAVCADGSVLEMTEVQPPNKKPMAARAFWNGLRGASLFWVRPDAPAPAGEAAAPAASIEKET